MGVSFTEEQQAVIDARDCNILVSAAAGSGKTAVLVERIIQMIMGGVDIDHLLVVTFTKAAALQMKEKITLAIQESLSRDPMNKHLQRQETLIHNAQITTIDSFCQYVLKNNFNTIGVDPAFHVGDDGELRLLQDEVMQDMLEEEYGKASEGQNEDFLYCMEYFATGSDDRKVESYISQLYKFSMSMPWPEDWIMERAGDYDIEGKDFESLPFVENCLKMTRMKISEHLDRLNVAEKVCCESDGPYMYGETLEKDIESVSALLKCKKYDDYFDALRTVSFGKLPIKKDDSVSPDKRTYVQGIRKKVKEGIDKLAESYFALPSETVCAQMALCDRAVKELCRLTLRYKQLFDEKKRDRQFIDFNDMEHFALQILVNHPDAEQTIGKSCQEIIDMCTPSTVALEYRDFYKEVLIDEYQDSNNVQELILKSISGEIPDKSERFMVGDVKQSIYKFRLARPEIFMEKLHTYDKTKGAKNHRIDLHKNFRSRKEVLEATNYIFEKIMKTDLGSVEYDEDARLVPGASYDEPKMDVTPELIMFESDSESEALSDYDAKEKEALVVAEKIHALMDENHDLKFKDIVILLRSVSGFDDIFKRILDEQGIPAYIESKSGYFNAWEVAVMLDFLTVIDNPSQDIPLTSVMHSCIGGFDDEELARLRIMTDEVADECLIDSFYYGLKKLLEKKKDSDETLDKLAKFIDMVEMLRKESVYTPVHEVLQRILDITGFDTYCLAMPSGNQRKANLDQLLQRAQSFEKTSFKGLFHFVRYIENMKLVQVDYGEAGIIDENADVVRIMSIHKSKGLEFPVVFVSGLSKKFNKRDITGDLIADMDFGVGVKCIDTNLRVKYDTLKRLMIADKMDTDTLGEELRVLYVALTRPKEKLILTASVKKMRDFVTSTLKTIPVLASSNGVLPYSTRAGATSYLDLVLPSLIRHPGVKEMLNQLEISDADYTPYVDKREDIPAFSFTALSDEKIVSAMLKREALTINRKSEFMEKSLSFDDELAGRLRAKFESKYAYDYLKGLFTKTTVTELKKHKLEEAGEVFGTAADYADDNETQFSEEIEFSDAIEDMFGEAIGNVDVSEERSLGKEETTADRKYEIDTADGVDGKTEKATAGAEKKKKLTGAERGTAYHRIMEILDDRIYGDEKLMQEALSLAEQMKKEKQEELKTKIGTGKKAPLDAVSKRVYGWLYEKVREGFISDDYRACMWPKDVTTFLSTKLGQRMGAAFRSGQLMREKPFMMGVPASELDPKFPQEEMVLIQGIIDAWFIEDGEIVLLDYKTDKVKESQELIDRYKIQLDLYKQALERTTNMKVKEVFIYSFALGEVIELAV
ncbi:helicase-exonuclease AddAB subunit AddA [Butyrivibrio sp. YAB3001]|uniref:helicase-exonuclease AddAB subunit AddA n=1 Tax=Butyrivibrio sp. YAB3001 TaxID=1520812 RepID=UPI0008F6201C|nr:helicase-exonuclease AddAB subunit AddA [Butyrivibrio sp. YAB3001]SFC39984.1 DNA helicase/exodeoxyribonuclease V, subunit A [Butyrivibrio sp. YAB3001]